MSSRHATGVPATVERYVKEHEEQGADTGKAWALAWSRYCAYKNPGSPRCKQDEYFAGRGASAARVATRWVNGASLSQKVKSTVTRAMDEGGFGGRGRWKTVGSALADLGVILGEFSLEFAEVVVAKEVAGPSGRRDFRVAVSDPLGETGPEEIGNSRVSVHWTQLNGDRYEVVAYLS